MAATMFPNLYLHHYPWRRFSSSKPKPIIFDTSFSLSGAFWNAFKTSFFLVTISQLFLVPVNYGRNYVSNLYRPPLSLTPVFSSSSRHLEAFFQEVVTLRIIIISLFDLMRQSTIYILKHARGFSLSRFRFPILHPSQKKIISSKIDWRIFLVTFLEDFVHILFPRGCYFVSLRIIISVSELWYCLTSFPPHFFIDYSWFLFGRIWLVIKSDWPTKKARLLPSKIVCVC